MEITNVATQTITAGSVVTFDSTAVRPTCCMAFREGSGTVILKGQQNGKRRYLISFEGNVALPTGADVVPISLALALDGEPIESTRMISSPATAGVFNNVSVSTYIDVPCGCCLGVSVENTTGATIEVSNASLLAVRTA